MALLSKMAWSKSTRIKVMITIDTLFFLVELISGFLAHSLALTADAFHMLNDIISLIIGLWAVVAAQKATTDEFTFGWVRAEILGAFFNAVFLIALCVSIVLEALTRFVEPPEITNPKLILIVGCAGLFSNFLGFFVLGGHGHSHGHGDEHEHDHGHDHSQFHNRYHDEEEAVPYKDFPDAADENGTAADILPEVIVRRATAAQNGSSSDSPETVRRIRFGDDQESRDESNSRDRGTPSRSRGRDRRRHSRSGHSGLTSIEDISIHPASFRQGIIAASKAASSSADPNSTSESEAENGSDENGQSEQPREEAPLLSESHGTNGAAHSRPAQSPSRPGRSRRDSSIHNGHNHTIPKQHGKVGSHGHSHGDMGMNAMVLHVIGDALGNLGVILTALIIWLTDWPGRVYADPAVSLVITAIILKTSIPLTRATSRVLLQATPENISIQEIRQDIEALPGVVSCHHIHVWQLSDTKVIASMHLQVEFPINTHSGEKYMQLARRARKCLHGFGIHSATIQPEFCLASQQQRRDQALSFDGQLDGPTQQACLLECADDCEEQGCCGGESASAVPSVRRASSSTIHEDSPHGH